jgi:hypothetical protein
MDYFVLILAQWTLHLSTLPDYDQRTDRSPFNCKSKGGMQQNQTRQSNERLMKVKEAKKQKK